VTRKYQYGKEEVTTFCVPAPVQQVAVCHQRQETASDDNEPVTLSAVVRISFNDYFFTADGFYRGPSRFTSSLADVKPSFVKEKCDIQPFKTDFTAMASNMEWLRDAISTPGVDEKQGFVGSGEHTPLKFCHTLFEVKFHHGLSMSMANHSMKAGEGLTMKTLIRVRGLYTDHSVHD
jgi:hypothetical protein